ncbi:MAG: MarR family winged helix-turn-helix transcriptional regulator [Rhodothermales bacterium]
MDTSLKAKLRQNIDFQTKAHEASLALMVAAVHVRRQSEAMFKKYGLNYNYYNVLRILRGARTEGYPRCDIIARMIDPAPDVTRLMDQLVKKGWVRRERSEHDRRQSLHWITDEGKQLLLLIDVEIEQINERFAESVGDEDLDHLIRIASKIYSAQPANEQEC